MSENNRIVWSEGLFLRPQHFQQQERYLEGYVRGPRRRRCVRIRWGFTELEIERDLLAIGKFGLRRARGVFPDGTPFRDAGESSRCRRRSKSARRCATRWCIWRCR